MSIEITGVPNGAAHSVDRPPAPPAQVAAKAEQPSQPKPDIKAAVQELDQVSQVYDRRLQFSVNPKLNEVVVKVIDSRTDKVIREIPEREIQIMHERLREALGLIFDARV